MTDELLHTALPFRAKRVASWNREGFNRDWIIIPPGQTQTLADLAGPRMIVHIWCAVDNRFQVVDPLFLRKNTLEIYWND